MNKKELEQLNSQKCIIKPIDVPLPQGNTTRMAVFFSLTPGEYLTLQHALQSYHSVVGQDLVAYFDNAVKRSGTDL